jgi:hypothetical protein
MDDERAAHALTLYKNSKARFAPLSRAATADGFCLESLRTRYSFYKMHPARLPLALYLSGQLKLFHIYPVNMVNSKKEYPDKMVGNHFEHLQDGPKGKV